MYAQNRDTIIDAFRTAVLAALDETAAEHFLNPPKRAAGATDGDLPELFRAIDAHTERLATRYGVVLVNYETPAL